MTTAFSSVPACPTLDVRNGAARRRRAKSLLHISSSSSCQEPLDAPVDFAKTARARRVADLAGAELLFDESADSRWNSCFTRPRQLPADVAFIKAEAVAERPRISAGLRRDRLAHVADGEHRPASAVVHDGAGRVRAKPITIIRHPREQFAPDVMKDRPPLNAPPLRPALSAKRGAFKVRSSRNAAAVSHRFTSPCTRSSRPRSLSCRDSFAPGHSECGHSRP
jgi:hypothetical protein